MAKALTNVDDADYSMYDKETETLLAKSDVDLQYNASKMVYYSDLLSSIVHKKWPKAATKAKKKVKKYTTHVDAIRKAKAALLKSAKPSKGRKKSDDFDPNPFISSDEEDYTRSVGSVDPEQLISSEDEGEAGDEAVSVTNGATGAASDEEEDDEDESADEDEA